MGTIGKKQWTPAEVHTLLTYWQRSRVIKLFYTKNPRIAVHFRNEGLKQITPEGIRILQHCENWWEQLFGGKYFIYEPPVEIWRPSEYEPAILNRCLIL